MNFDRDDNVADGQTHGMFLRLRDLLHDRELVGAGDLVGENRGIKSETERERITAPAETTTALLDGVAAAWTPDTTEADVSEYRHRSMRARPRERVVVGLLPDRARRR